MILETLIVLFSFQPANAIAAEQPSRTLVREYESEMKSLRSCLDTSSLATACMSKLSSLLSRVNAIHQCLPVVPDEQGTGGAYKVSVELTYPGGCKAEADEWNTRRKLRCSDEHILCCEKSL